MGSFFIARKRIQAPYGTPAPPPLRQPDRSTLEGRILTLLAQSPRPIDDVCQSLGCDPGEAGSTLIILEVRGLIRQRPDLRYALT